MSLGRAETGLCARYAATAGGLTETVSVPPCCGLRTAAATDNTLNNSWKVRNGGRLVMSLNI